MVKEYPNYMPEIEIIYSKDLNEFIILSNQESRYKYLQDVNYIKMKYRQKGIRIKYIGSIGELDSRWRRI